MKLLEKITGLLPKEYTYTAGQSSEDTGFKFVIDATPQLRKTVKDSLIVTASVVGGAIVLSSVINALSKK